MGKVAVRKLGILEFSGQFPDRSVGGVRNRKESEFEMGEEGKKDALGV